MLYRKLGGQVYELLALQNGNYVRLLWNIIQRSLEEDQNDVDWTKLKMKVKIEKSTNKNTRTVLLVQWE